MSGQLRDTSGSRALLGWAIGGGIIVFGLTLVPLWTLAQAYAATVGNNWALPALAVVVALLLALVTLRLIIGIGRSAALSTTDEIRRGTAFWKRPWVPWALIALALLMFVGLAFALLALVHTVDLPNELSLPLLAIAGVVALLSALALVSVSLNLVNMGDKTQALGLPQGSVRAVIALSLVVLFAILTVYLFSSLNGEQIQTIATCVTEDQAKTMAAIRPGGETMVPRPDKSCPIQDGKPPASYDVIAVNPASQAGIDFAKQLLVLIGTLVTSVASFYFGSRAVGEARDVMAGLNIQPSLQGVDPPTLTPDSSGEATLDLLGTGLNGARQVQLTRDGDQLNAVSVTSNDNRAHAKFNTASGLPSGGDPWDVTVTDSQGRSARLSAAVKIAPGGAGTGAQTQQTPATSGQKPAEGAAAALADLQTKLKAQLAGITALDAVDKGAALPTPPAATVSALNQWLAAAEALLKGAPDATTAVAAVQSGTALLETVQNAGLPGALADVIAVLQQVGTVAGPAIAGVPAGPAGIVLGVLAGLIELAGDQRKLNAAKAALLNTAFDPATPPALPTRDEAVVAVAGTAFAGASPDQALTIMQAALQQRGGQPVPTNEVITTLLANTLTAPLMQQFATPALSARAIEQLRGDALFRQARDLLKDAPALDVPAALGAPAGKVSLATLLDWLQARRTDPAVAGVIDKLAGIGEALAKLPGGQQAALGLLVAALEAAASLAQTRRQS